MKTPIKEAILLQLEKPISDLTARIIESEKAIYLEKIGKELNMTPFWNDNGTMQFFEVGQFDWQRDNKTFVQEASILGIGSPAATLMIKNPKTGNRKSFKMCGVDRSVDAIYGWRYKTNDGLKALIIND